MICWSYINSFFSLLVNHSGDSNDFSLKPFAVLEVQYDTQSDHLIVGSGIAGLMLAHKLGQKDRVTVIAKSKIIDNNTNYAQGGIASVLSPDDSYDKHIQDTMTAGAGLCHEKIVDIVVRGGPDAIEELIARC